MTTDVQLPLGLDAIKGPGEVPTDSPDDKDGAERSALRFAQLRADLTHRQQMDELRRASYSQDTRERKSYAIKIFWLVTVWLGLVFLLLILNGFKRASVGLGSSPAVLTFGWHFELSDKVLVSIIAGTTVDVIGLFAVVASYLFFRPGRKSAAIKNQRDPARKRGGSDVGHD